MLVLVAQGRPLVVSYQGDGSPALTRVFKVIRLEEGKYFRREGGKCCESYMERCQVHYFDAEGKRQGRILAREARNMKKKSAWCAYSAAR